MKSSGQMHEDLSVQEGVMKGFPVFEASQMIHSILLSGSPCSDAWGHRENSQELTQRYETASAYESRETWKKCPLPASQCPLAAGIQYSVEERLRFPSASLVRLVLQPRTARQSLSQDISLFPRHTITSLFLPVLKHTVLASVCNLKCQVPSLWHHKGVSYP